MYKDTYLHAVAGVTSSLGTGGFDWDRDNSLKVQKHGVSLAEIEAIFEQPVAVFPDIAHSPHEERFIAIGENRVGRRILLVFTLRKRNSEMFIRPISARYMHKKEIEYYEEAAKTQKR
jgi:uncharacterized DUF497 family protein